MPESDCTTACRIGLPGAAMHDNNEARKRFSELLPFYVNDTLDAPDLAWMESYVSGNADAQKEYQFEKLLRETTRSTVSQRTEAEREASLLAELRRARSETPWWRRLLGDALPAQGGTSGALAIPIPAFVLVAVLVIGQAIYIGATSMRGTETHVYRNIVAPCAVGPQLRLIFKADAKNVDVVLLLRDAEASITAGPSATGEIWVVLPAGASVNTVQATLRSSPIVQSVVVSGASSKSPGCGDK